MSIVTLESDFIHYEVLGRGRPLIFLHGWVGSWRYWIPTMQAASISYRTYAIDLWGFGDTAKRSDKYSLDHQSRLLYSFMDAMGIGKIALIGHGLGALVALNFVRANPLSVDRLSLTGIPMGNAAINPRLRTATVVELADWLLGKVPEAEAARIEAPKADLTAIRASLDGLQTVDLTSQIMELRTPCVFIHGYLDPVIELPPDELFSRMPENTHQVVFEGSGHFPMLDEANKYNRLLADFLALPSGESPRSLQLKDEWKRRIR